VHKGQIQSANHGDWAAGVKCTTYLSSSRHLRLPFVKQVPLFQGKVQGKAAEEDEQGSRLGLTNTRELSQYGDDQFKTTLQAAEMVDLLAPLTSQV
jgi:hypothetical protein